MTTRAFTAADAALGLATICFLLVCGASAYEHAVVVPRWTASPPASLAMFQGAWALRPGQWWMVAHWPALLLCIAALVLVRRQPRRRLVTFAVGGYVLVLAATLGWFVPELVALTADAGAAIAPSEWKARADRWELLSLVRMAVMLVLGGALVRAVSAQPAAR